MVQVVELALGQALVLQNFFITCCIHSKWMPHVAP